MKRLLAFTIAFSMGIMTTVSATEPIKGEYKNSSITISHKSNCDAVLNIYDNGILSASVVSKNTDGKYSFKIDEKDKDKQKRLVIPDENIFDVETVTPTAVPEKTQRPEVYEKNLDALNAPAVVKDVEQIQKDGELYYKLSMLYQGDDIVADVRDFIEISSAPASAAYMIGKNANSLQEGDVIHFTCDLQGRIKDIKLLHRPEFINYIENEVNFADLVGDDLYSDYSFGVVTDTFKNSIYLANKSGNVTEIDVDSRAFVYTVSQNARNDKVDFAGTGAKSVSSTSIDKDNLTDNDDVISWSGVEDIVYALVRQVRGTAIEIIVFE